MARFDQPSFLAGAPHPLVVHLPGRGKSPLDLYSKIAAPSQVSFLLETGKGTPDTEAFSFFGSGAASVISLEAPTMKGFELDPFAPLKDLIGPPGIEPSPELPPFFGGAVGYFGYDFIRRIENLPSNAQQDLRIPDLQFASFDLVAALNHRTDELQLIYCPSMTRFLGEPREKLYREGLDRLAEWEARLTNSQKEGPPPVIDPIVFAAEQTSAAYLERVRRCQNYIAAGDIYQANLSHRFQFTLPESARSGPPRLAYEQSLYRRLRSVNPSPFSGLLHFGDVSLVSSSPERLVRLSGRKAETRPIAGTRPRGAGDDADRTLVGELLSSEKERAEHLMLVDLARNDLGRVCAFGTVRVDEFMAVEQYSHVSHIVSNVSGTLRSDATPYDLIGATFPGGTITGVPKIRCMEIIDELEPVRRGPYTGSFGYLGWNGDLDLNIIIRTLVLSEGRGYLQVGAGIVADSDPVKEYEETLHKARAFLSTLQQA